MSLSEEKPKYAHDDDDHTTGESPPDSPFVVVLGIVQDGGYPQAGCNKQCCTRAWNDDQHRQYVTCLAIVDPKDRQRWFLDCTPDFREQLHELNGITPSNETSRVDGILLTHAHIGHYVGLMHLGREAMGANCVPVYAMPHMRRFLECNGPWNQLIASRNIEIHDLTDGTPLLLNNRISVTPFTVPHRVGYSETVGFYVQGPVRAAIYLPDIDDWGGWGRRIEDVISSADVAYLDGTFFADGELVERNMAEIPHPLITESIERFSVLPARERSKIRFLHLNHTNPVLDLTSDAAQKIIDSGHRIACQGECFEL
jgi:pyrroloquinoline quinone biosynthesis protein B